MAHARRHLDRLPAGQAGRIVIHLARGSSHRRQKLSDRRQGLSDGWARNTTAGGRRALDCQRASVKIVTWDTTHPPRAPSSPAMPSTRTELAAWTAVEVPARAMYASAARASHAEGCCGRCGQSRTRSAASTPSARDRVASRPPPALRRVAARCRRAPRPHAPSPGTQPRPKTVHAARAVAGPADQPSLAGRCRCRTRRSRPG